MKWAVYTDQQDRDIDCIFFDNEDTARKHIVCLIKECEQASADEEENLRWDITLLEVKGECHWTQDGLTLLPK